MGLRWQLYDPEFYTDVIDLSGFEFEEEKSDDDYVCRCSGRGKSDGERFVPRIPRAKQCIKEEIPVIYSEQITRKKGKGRGRALKEKVENVLRPVGGPSSSREQRRPVIDRPRREPMFLNNSCSFLEIETYVGKRPSPFDILYAQTASVPPPNSQKFEEEFPSLMSSQSSTSSLSKLGKGDKTSSSSRWMSDSESISSSAQDLRNPASVCKDSVPVSSNNVNRSSSSQDLMHPAQSYNIPVSCSDDSRSSSSQDLRNLAAIFKGSLPVSCSSESRSSSSSQDQRNLVSSASSSTRNLLLGSPNTVLQSSSNMSTTSSNEDLYTSDGEELDYSQSYETMSSASTATDRGDHQWVMIQGNVIQLDGLPKACDLSSLEGLIAQYGVIQHTQIIENKDTISIRYRLSDGESCDWVISCLDGTDCLFPDSTHTLSCFRVS